MHELTLATAMVEQVQSILKKEKAQKLLSITVAMGVLSGVDRASLAFCFPLVTEGTSLAESKLHIVETPLRVTCQPCGQQSLVGGKYLFLCGVCGSQQVSIVEDQELMIQSLEIL